jgi:hypothetical protein
MKKHIIAVIGTILVIIGVVSIFPTTEFNKLINKIYDYDSEYFKVKTKIIANAEDMNKCSKAITALEQQLVIAIKIEQSRGVEPTKEEVTQVAFQALPIIKRFCK